MRFLIPLFFLFPVFAETKVLKKFNISLSKEVKQGIGEDRAWKFGSGLAFRKNSRNLSFYIISSDNDSLASPLIGVLDIKKDQAKISRFTKVLNNDEKLDLEAIAVAENKKLWLADEKKPSILKVDSESGKIEQTLSPGSGLPEVLKNIRDGRGFEGIAIDPHGQILIATQSLLNLGQNSGVSLIRFIRYNPKTNSSQTYAYLPETDYVSFDEAKVGDLQAINDKEFILIEQGQKLTGYTNRIYLINLEDASDLSQVSKEPELEFVSQTEFVKKYKPIKKKLIVDLNKLGWKYKKAEGLALLDNGGTIAVTNDPENKKEGLKIWLIQLEQSLIVWSWREWAMLVILPLIFLFSMIFFARGMISGRQK